MARSLERNPGQWWDNGPRYFFAVFFAGALGFIAAFAAGFVVFDATGFLAVAIK